MNIFDRLAENRVCITGVGSALVDILAREDDAFLKRLGAVKGGMTYAEPSFIDQAVKLTTSKPPLVPGGSACNTVVGVARLGGKARFVGKCGSGPVGRQFRKDLENQGVESRLLSSQSPNGRVLSIITPDAQRSMFTFLGASAELLPAEMTPDCFADAAIVHIEGYLLFNPELIVAAMKSAKSVGALISLDLASHTVVDAARDILPELIEAYVDILVANEDEAFAYTGFKDETEAIKALGAHVDLAVVKIGSRGSLVSHDGEMIRIDAQGDGKALDTTGAGDLWASGFLYGLVNRMPLAKCGAIASLCGYEVCQVMGAAIPDERWKVIKTLMEM